MADPRPGAGNVLGTQNTRYPKAKTSSWRPWWVTLKMLSLAKDGKLEHHRTHSGPLVSNPWKTGESTAVLKNPIPLSHLERHSKAYKSLFFKQMNKGREPSIYTAFLIHTVPEGNQAVDRRKLFFFFLFVS